MKKEFHKSLSPIQAVLTTLYVVSLLIANIVASKQVQLPFGIVMTGAIFIFPVTYILSDIFSEIYGFKWSRITCQIAFLANILAVSIFSLVIITPAPAYWENQNAFATVLGSTPKILIASLAAFYLGDYVNDKIFCKMKEKHGDSKFGLRAIVSSLCGEFTDSLIFIPLAFIGTMPINKIMTMIIIQPTLKVLYEILIFPITNKICKKLKKIERSEIECTLN
ncbi:MAG: queuosine precursor transporter [Sphaerochaetaceae bacterium]|jgi:uncharacterized integral membrane protein (TIGR00697 family)